MPQVTEASHKYVTVKLSFLKSQEYVDNWKKLCSYKRAASYAVSAVFSG